VYPDSNDWARAYRLFETLKESELQTMNATIKIVVAVAASLLSYPNANAQHLWWNLEDQRDATC